MSDIALARKYVNKANSCIDRGIPFELSFNEYKRLMTLKRCFYTRLPLTHKLRTLDRVDNALGYTKENTVACHCDFNAIKSVWENPVNSLTQPMMLKAMVRLSLRN